MRSPVDEIKKSAELNNKVCLIEGLLLAQTMASKILIDEHNTGILRLMRSISKEIERIKKESEIE